MKDLDIKSLLIGTLLTATIFLGVAATSKDDKGKWDEKQEWKIIATFGDSTTRKGLIDRHPIGWEPFTANDDWVWWRKRIK
jgi:hypothetical protein